MTHHRPQRPLPGRDRELAEIDAALAAVLDGQLRIVLISGEAGIGKSRLLDEVDRRARAMGVEISRSACDEETMPVAFAPLRQVISSGTPVEIAFSPGELQHRLAVADTCSELLRARTTVQPFALLIDDIHWLDDSSSTVLRRVTRSLRFAPLALVVTYRSDDLRPRSAGDRFVAAVRSDPMTRLVPLRRLSEEATVELVAARVGREVGETAALGKLVYQQSEGVPLFAIELVDHLDRAGMVRDGGERMVANAAAREIPGSIHALLDQRLGRLDDAHRAIIEAAAVGGMEIGVAPLRHVVAAIMPDLAGAVPNAIERAVSIGLLRPVPGSPSAAWRFSHRLFRDCLYDGLRDSRRRVVHDAYGIALERLANGQRQVERIAYHAVRGRDVDRGLDWAVTAARSAAAMQAWEDAVNWIDIALDLQESSPDPARDRFSLLEVRDQYLAAVGDPAARLGNALALERMASLEVDDARRARALSLAVRGFVAGGAIEDARRLASQLDPLARTEPHSSEPLRWVAIGEAATSRPAGEPAPLTATTEELQRARDAYLRALADATDDDVVTGLVLQELGVIEAALAGKGLVDRNAPRQRLLASLEVRRRASDRRGETTALIALAYLRDVGPAGEMVDYQDSFVSFLEEIRRLRATEHRIAGGTHQARAEALALLSTHLYCRTHGWYEIALDRGGQASQAAATARDPRLAILAEIGLAETNWLVGRGERALDHAERAAASIERMELTAGADLSLRREVDVARVRAHWVAGDKSRAVSIARGQASRTTATGPRHDGDMTALLVELLARESPTEAQELARAALRGAGSLPTGVTWDIRLDLALSEIALANSDIAAAVGHAAAAAARVVERRTPIVWLQLAVGRGQVDALLASGLEEQARESARGIARLAATLLGRVSDPRLRDDMVARAPALASALRVIASKWPDLMPDLSRRARRDDGPLTPREIEVLRLVAAGRSNREIADTLYISEKTVARHLTNMFNKIDAQSRTQAAAWAFRNGIV